MSTEVPIHEEPFHTQRVWGRMENLAVTCGLVTELIVTVTPSTTSTSAPGMAEGDTNETVSVFALLKVTVGPET